MAVVITFKTAAFDTSAEPENPFNPIAGRSGLVWLTDKISALGYSSSEPAAEDWGWYIDVNDAQGSYLVGAIAFTEDTPETGGELEWLFQIDNTRSFVEKLLGKNKIDRDDRLAQTVFDILKRERSIDGVEWQDDA